MHGPVNQFFCDITKGADISATPSKLAFQAFHEQVEGGLVEK